MSLDPSYVAGAYEKASAGWFGGCNSNRMPWLLDDSSYRFGYNIVNRGGIVQTRPGKRLVLVLPPGLLQGMVYFRADRSDEAQFLENAGDYLVFAVAGSVYYAPFPLQQPTNWDFFKLRNISLSPNAPQVMWEIGQKSVNESATGTLSIVPTFSVLMVQDGGVSPAGYWDGTNDGQLDESSAHFETPQGSWMKWVGNRLWIARGNIVLASDLLDPLSFTERIDAAGGTNGDFKFTSDVTGLGSTLDQNRQTNLVVFTAKDTSTLLSSITDRTTWSKTENFQTTLYPALGCVAGKSIINHAGLLWWYAHGGLVNSDSASAAYLTSKISYRDVEMAQSRRNFTADLSGICSFSHESYMGMSVPSGDTLNAHTMVLDYSVSDELNQTLAPPAWNSVWTGTRPVEWASADIDGKRRLFEASVDYQAVTTGVYTDSFNHIWEDFQDDRSDSYTLTDTQGNVTVVRNPIYGEVEFKQLGDTMELKKFHFGEIDLIELGGVVNVRVTVAGAHGAFHELSRKQIIANLDSFNTSSTDLQALMNQIGTGIVQGRRIATAAIPEAAWAIPSVESKYADLISKVFTVRLQWCGRLAIECFHIHIFPYGEKPAPTVEVNEDQYNVLTQDGLSFTFDDESGQGGVNPNNPIPIENLPSSAQTFVSPFTPRYRETFYSSVPVLWQDLPDNCITCLPCGRDTFSPQLTAPIIINGVNVTA